VPIISGGGGNFDGGTITQPLFLESAATGADATQLMDVTNGDATELLYADSAGSWIFTGDASQAASLSFNSTLGTLFAAFTGTDVVQVTQRAIFVLARTTAPADASLAAGQCALWLDDTNGASKFMVKAKSANGTVVTGSVTLA
jgi:hypothetical protein